MKNLIKKILKEESNSPDNNLKKFFIKRWDEQKQKGLMPSIYDINKLGLSNKRNEILSYYSEYMGYDGENSRSNVVKQYLLNHIFTEKEITEMKDSFDDGKIEVRFDNVEFNEIIRYKFLIELDIKFTVLSGSFYNSMEERVYNFSSEENEFEDFVEYWEFKEAIEQVVEAFVFETLEAFGYDINDDFDYIKVEWD